jgi:hypothetical protein
VVLRLVGEHGRVIVGVPAARGRPGGSEEALGRVTLGGDQALARKLAANLAYTI